MSDSALNEAIEYLTGIRGGSINPGLSRIKNLLEELGNPQDDLKCVHVAGTNGKGSVCAFVSSVLIKAGFKVGVFTSPAVFDYRERYRVGKKNISAADLVKMTELVRAAACRMEERGLEKPSSFETETALAFLYFKEKNCDIAVIETGMGGLEDSTNIIEKPLCSVIASVSFDHMAFLGDSLEKIAFQKAGIIKPGCPVVSARQHKEAARVIEDVAKEKKSNLTTVDEDKIKDRKVSKASIFQLFDYKEHKKIEISLLGKYQLKNAALAIETVEVLRSLGLRITDKALYEGLKEASWPGRFQILSDKPAIIVDGAHNEEAALRLSDSLLFYFTNRRIVYIMGMLKDKEYEKVSEITAPLAEQIFTVETPGNKRALPAIELAETVKHFNKNVTATDSLYEALEMAKMVAGTDGVIVIFGSLSFLGQITELTKNGPGKDKTSSKPSARSNR
ncbi:MAG: bifunctional folylpolyglutamate synthase/dihydrofolate synthase [Lachnospiraceae bacterium]|nr:bifunctional folylpolyglutamate synthase/dihydrofolate synthase [Lachnospiraceae bacterium]